MLTSQLTPRIVHRTGPTVLVAGGLAVAATGLVVLMGVSAESGVAVAVLGSVIISLGMGPVFGLTTELVVGSAPPAKAGAASGISETAAELGGALGIAVFGSVGVAIYRNGLDELPAGVTPAAADAARDTLGGAVAAAGDLPADVGSALLDLANVAFVDGMRVSTGIAAGLAFALTVVAWAGLRVAAPKPDEGAGPDRAPEPANPIPVLTAEAPAPA